MSDELAKSVKKLSNADRVSHYKAEFQKVEKAAHSFEVHDASNDALQYAALEAIFDFGQQIRLEPDVFEAFVLEHKLPWNKVTQKNPYNALIRLALPASTEKAWFSQCSRVLAYAHDHKPNEALRDWLVANGGISGCYKKAVEHFERSTTDKTGRSRAKRLEVASQKLIDAPLTDALSGIDMKGAAPGFFRSLVYFDGTDTRLVHVRDMPDHTAIETYLLDLVGPSDVETHAVADKPLFRFYRAVDLILGSCGESGSKEERHLLIWNDVQDDKTVTRLNLVSDLYTFANAVVTLTEAIPELDGKGLLLLAYADAKTFRKNFQYDDRWRFEADGSEVHLASEGKTPLRYRLAPLVERKAGRALRAGAAPTRRARHFRLTVEQMQSLISNTETVKKLCDNQNQDSLTPYPKPKRFQLRANGKALLLDTQEQPSVQTLFVDFKRPSANFQPHRELAIEDMVQLCETLERYKDDVTGHFADSDVEDAAFCINHDFLDGDRFEYTTPLVISVKMDRTLICEDLVAPILPSVAVPPAPASPFGPAKGSALSAGASISAKPLSTGRSASVSAPSARARNYELIEKNRRTKTTFPATPLPCRRAFGAFITSYLPNDPEHRESRKFDFEWQLEWWRRMTDIPVHVIASNWSDDEVAASSELGLLAAHRGSISRVGPRILIENRIDCLNQLYASNFDWGIIMDDDAVLMQEPQHNSSYRLFAEMAENGVAAYASVDVFAPIYGRKVPFNKELNGEGNPYSANHVFKKNTDLKGSMIVVKNFQKEGRAPLLPDPSFSMHGEDTYLVLQALALGYSTMTSWNMVLEELSGQSTFASGDDDRKDKMRDGHERLCDSFGHLGLRMKEGSHTLDKREFERQCWGEKAKKLVVSKPR